MNVDDPLSRDFLLNYPAEAARCLEQVSVEHVAALFTELPSSQVLPAMASMLPEKAAECLELMSPVKAAALLTELPVSSAARIYRLLTHTKNQVSAQLADEIHRKLRHHMVYSSESAGALLNSRFDALHQDITVAEAIRRIERLEHTASCEIYIIDVSHRLVGSIELGKILTSDHHAVLRDIMNRKTQPVSAHAPAESLPSHPGWKTHHRLPVVDRDNTLVGVLDYSVVRYSVSETEVASSRDPLENILSIASLYWLSLAQLLDSIISVARSEKGERQ